MKKALVFIETRSGGDLKRAVERHRDFLPGWYVHIVCSANNAKSFGFYDEMEFARINSAQDYNRLLTSKEFWGGLPYDKVLIAQADSGLLRPGIDEFLEWDYVGAPWVFSEWGGNGGLSLRTVETMFDITDGANWKGQNEDVFFCNIMRWANTWRLAPREVCSRFSVEKIFQLGTLGYHAIDRYFNESEVDSILNQYEN